MTQIEKTFNILSIEDNKADFELIKKAISSIKDLSIKITNIDDGEKALQYICNNHIITPDLIILDLNLPSIDGIDLLKIIKNKEQYKIIPIIIFTTSDKEEDIYITYKNYANSYITKTYDVNDFLEKIYNLIEFWLKTSKLPNNNICFIQHNLKEKK